ncbi:MAG: hypothetical protein WCT99_08640 [Bacteroidota bacterium]
MNWKSSAFGGFPAQKEFIEEMSWTSSAFGGFPAQKEYKRNELDVVRLRRIPRSN